MSLKIKIMSTLLACSLILSACGQAKEAPKSANQPKVEASQSQEITQGEADKKGQSDEREHGEEAFAVAFDSAKTELDKAKEGKEVNYQQVIDTYTKDLQPLVQKNDTEFSESIDQQLTTALGAGKDGSMDGIIVKQLFDKLMQKVFFLTIRHEFKEVDGNWGNKEEMKEKVEEAKQYLEVLVGTVEKRDAVYQTTMKGKIEAGINQIEKAVEDGDKLAFLLGKQVVDKTLMKTFYLAVGALPHGYAGKVAAEASVDAKKAKTEQAEGWAFYQSIYGYIVKNAEEQAEFIQKQFDLSTDVKTLDPEAINKAFVVGFSKVALHEYEESVENWGQDKSVVTALEGALFIDIIEADLKRIIGEDAFKTLNDQTQKYLDAVKAQNKDQAEQLLENINKTLNDVVAKASAA